MRTTVALHQSRIHAGTPLVLGLALLGWGYSFALVLTMDAAGSFAQAGPGMQLFAVLEAGLTRNPLAIEALSLCVTSEPQWTLIDFGKALGMWIGMVLAMMLPVLLPLLRRRQELPLHSSFPEFVTGYAVAWLPFCVVATLCQYLLRRTEFLNEFMVSDSTALTVGIFTFVALFYFARSVRSQLSDDWGIPPLPRQMNSLRDGVACGAWTLRHCWPLMTVMFAVGLMNIVAMAILTALMFANLLQRGHLPGALIGPAALATGAAMLSW